MAARTISDAFSDLVKLISEVQFQVSGEAKAALHVESSVDFKGRLPGKNYRCQRLPVQDSVRVLDGRGGGDASGV